MSDDKSYKSLDAVQFIDHDESISEELDSPHAEMTSIHNDFSSTAERHDDGVESAASAVVVPPGQSAVRINVYDNIPFAGGDGDYSILSVLFGAHSIGEGIFSFMTMKDSNKVRVQCRECHQAVKDFPWMDNVSWIKGNIKAWRAAFPCARAVNVSKRDDIVDADFVHIRGDARVRLHTVNLSDCTAITDAAFVHLRGIHTLNIGGCKQITDAAFTYLSGIHTLNMCFCNQATITDNAFVHLRGIHTLDMSYCYQATITPLAITHLAGIEDLNTRRCSEAVQIASAALMNIEYDSGAEGDSEDED